MSNGISSNQVERRDEMTARERHLERRVANMEAVLLADPSTDRAHLVAALTAVQYAAEEAERLRNELDALLVERTGMNSAAWAQEELDYMEFQRRDNRSGGVATCRTCGRGAFVDGTADMDLSAYECLSCERKRITGERDRAVALVREVAVAFGEWSTTPDSFVSARLLEAMASCQEFVAGEPPKGERP